MAVILNHLIVPAHDKHASARFFAEILGLKVEDKSPGSPAGRFAVVRVGETNLDFDDMEKFEPHHYAFLVSEEEFDALFERLTKAGRSYSADPLHKEVGKLNSNQGGRGLYFRELNGHNIELLTRA